MGKKVKKALMRVKFMGEIKLVKKLEVKDEDPQMAGVLALKVTCGNK